MASLLMIVLLIKVAYGASEFPNFNVMSAGYNAMKGNPNSYGGVDPGYAHSIFQLIYNSSSTSCCNGTYIIPIGYEARETDACSTDFSFNANSGMSDYESQLNVAASISGSVFHKVKFRASTSYQKVENKLSSSNTYVASSHAECFVYEGYVDTSKTPPFTTNFIDAVKGIPNTYNKNDKVCNGADNGFSTFIENFGTHIPIQIQFGCIFGENTEISSNSYASFSSSNLNINVAASYHGIFVSGSASAMTSDEKKQAAAYGSVISDNRTFSVGSQVGLLDYTSWAKNCKSSPQPVRIYESEPIQNLLTSHNFPSISDIHDKQSALGLALEDYCECLCNQSLITTCNEFAPSPPTADRSIFDGMYTVDPSGRNPNSTRNNIYTGTLGCNDGFRAFQVGNTYPAYASSGDCIDTYICLNETIMTMPYDKRIDPMNYFGGMYSEYDNNPLTGNKSCPAKYTSTIIGWPSRCGSGTENGYEWYTCFNATTDLADTFLGGFYSSAAENYYTHAKQCPPAFKNYPALTLTNICINNYYE